MSDFSFRMCLLISGWGIFDLVVSILHDPALKSGMCAFSYTQSCKPILLSAVVMPLSVSLVGAMPVSHM